MLKGSHSRIIIKATDEDARDTHQLIRGLYNMLPASGLFTAREQAQWLEAARLNLALVYGSDELTPFIPPGDVS